MLPNRLSWLLGALLLAGCAAPPKPAPGSTGWGGGLGSTNAFITQRAVLRLRGREFTLNGYLAINGAGDMRMMVTEMFGQVLADVMLKHDGRIHVLRSSPLLRQAWIERYVATDVRCVFCAPSPDPCPVRQLGPNRFRIERPQYALDLRILENRPGPQSPELFEEANPPSRQ